MLETALVIQVRPRCRQKNDTLPETKGAEEERVSVSVVRANADDMILLIMMVKDSHLVGKLSDTM